MRTNGTSGDSGGAIQRTIDELHARYAGLTEGRVADYIPELAKTDPDLFGIAVVTVDGEVFTAGDAETTFTLQSISKPFVYGLALEQCGRQKVLQHVGVEPTGDAFNSIIKMDAANRPHNPCVNAGAIATTGLLEGGDPTARLQAMLGMFEAYIGEPVRVDMSVFTSERTTGHRNRAIAHLLLNFGLIEHNVEQILDLYFQQCSINVTTRKLAVMAATLANAGENPITGASAIEPKYLRDVLTVMYTCGMYDYAGEWAYTVGLPAKSGISGGILAVVPGVGGLAVFSPRLDEHGHSVRALRVCEDLSAEFGIHMFDACMHDGPGETVSGMFQRRSSREDEDRIVHESTMSPTHYEPDRGRAPEPGPESH